MTAGQQVREFCRLNRINVNASARVPMLSVSFAGGAMWIECFDSWPAAQAFLAKHRFDDVKPWSKSNTK